MIRIRHIALTLLLTAVAGAQPASPIAPFAPEPKPAGTIDVLDYFLQSDDKDESWTIGGTDVRPDTDPDGTGARTFVLNKWSDPNCYEVYKVTDADIELRYEVVRSGGAEGTGNWIRRYHELAIDRPGAGAVWCKRFVVPGQNGYLSRFAQDRFVFDPKTRSYVIDTGNSVKEFPSYLSVVRASNNWGRNNQTLFDLSDCIRIVAQWQREGKMFEMYDYARGKGLVAWRWAERLSTLVPMEGDTTGKIFHCENGYVYVQSRGDESFRPTVFKYDPKTGQRGESLELMKFKSYWAPDMGQQWYVIFRDTTREGPLVRKNEKIAHDFALPEWTTKPGATLKDLPTLYVKEP